MRVLFHTAPIATHTLPLVPLAWAMRSAGHDVVFATSGEGAVVRKAGLCTVGIAPDFEIRDLFAPLFERHQGLFESREPTAAETATLDEIYGALNSRLAPGLIEAAEKWRPDVVIHDTSAIAGALCAAVLGVPAIQHDIAVESSRGLRERVVAWMPEALDRFGVTGLPADEPVINIVPPSVEPDGQYGWPMRNVPYSGSAPLADLTVTNSRPTVAVTMGLTTGDMGPVGRIIDAAREVDADFLLALSGFDPSEYGTLPPNVQALGWTPLADLLPHCTAVINHGGAGTVLAAMAVGVPQLIFPGGIGHYRTAEAISRRGVGLLGHTDEIGPALFRRFLDDDKLRRAAAEVQAENEAMPSPADLVPRIVGLVEKSK
ncbi:nucleotide disphospho-sugar-binding domain-containing protein [Streptomyces inhibens]|uniref:nucleotide disphospho-sugar-binding domain-containing protein n=1 Tax=Streptomyces inhibens TaxID=2293571 RepID=UPI001EE77CAD|nr:nucleotide disphospho-sugar-binding domain-containing protein [Streptomyces inhibens]UKY51782.1 DUF1205 domain-containing protein [Streptomyces inhibens]